MHECIAFRQPVIGRREFARGFFSTYLFDTGVSQPVDVWERHGPSVANEDHA
jgi:hypothetical protein